ncbi:DUF3050 domain-containing protein [Flavobacterium sp. ASW18X]|uniref:DUF3050 domain-containing protein n=1 Tax=Flavobacterium sp. ASW18X TaxID=2572595 RepID=UPI0010AE8714|nr:DUF3050 domain-containing protein [Flavobacterium sp. ASW18X]TKD64993.1 DUF3050 domain-containing protein [Flavobacterium sp. ASW18X]
MTRIEQIETALLPQREALKNHELYSLLEDVKDIQCFMESHVYAVWDFMSLLKALQRKLTCTQVPWLPVNNSTTARFINEIVLEEETDVNELGVPKSHFSMYLDAMEEVGANTKQITQFLLGIKDLETIQGYINSSPLNAAEKSFLNFSFNVIKEDKVHTIAAAFTFGREDVIPDMFLNIIAGAERNGELVFPKMKYYLNRHIELDGDEHGPLALKMITELCGEDEHKWQEVLQVSKEALQQRINLWSSIAAQLKENKEKLQMA